MLKMTLTKKKGELIFSQNQVGKEMYFIHSGSVTIQKEKRGKKIELAVLKQGSLLGEMALIDGKPRSATAIAQEDCELLTISQAEFQKQISKTPPWYMALIRITSESLRKINTQLSGEQRLQNIANISQFLTLIHKRQASLKQKNQEAQSLKLNQVKQEILNILGVNREAVTHTFSFLNEAKIIQSNANILSIHDPEKLMGLTTFIRGLNNHNKSPIDNLLLENLIKLKKLLEDTFSKNEQTTFSFINFKTEMTKNAGFTEEELSHFLSSLLKHNLVTYFDSNQQETDSYQDMASNGQLKISSKNLATFLNEEEFKRMGLL